MSYILDALRKAEQERHPGQPTPLTPSLPPPAEPAQNRFWYGLVVLALVVNAVLLAFFLGHFQPKPSSPPPPSAAPSSAPPAPQAHASTPTVRPIPVAPPPPTQPTIRRPPEPPRPPPAPRVESPPPILTTTPPISTLDTLPTNVQRELPTLHLDIHVHSRDARKRFAVINGRRYREGEQLSEGPILEAVTTTGVTLRYGARRFQLVLSR